MSIYCCGLKANLVWIFLLNTNFLLVHRNKLSVTVYLFLALYGCTIIQSRSFLKNIKNFVWFPKQYLLGFFLLEKQLANIPDRGFLFQKILLGFLYFTETMRSKLSARLFLKNIKNFLYKKCWSTTLQSWSFLKKYQELSLYKIQFPIKPTYKKNTYNQY